MSKTVNIHISLTPFRNESRILKQTKSLITHGVFTEIHIHALWEDGLLKKERIDDNRTVWRHQLNTRKLPRFFFFQTLTYFELVLNLIGFCFRKKVHVVNIHSLGLMPIGVVLKLLFSAKLVYDAHELETETEGLTGFRKKLSKFAEKNLIPYMDMCIVVGEEIRKWYVNEYKCKNIEVVLNCPNYSKIQKNDTIRERLGIPFGKKIVLYLGGMSEGRGIRFLLNTFDLLRGGNYELVLIGYGELAGLATEHSKVNAHIHYLPAVNPEEVIKYASSADIGVSFIEDNCLSYHYCLPNKLFEYCMADVPVIVSDLPEMRRIVDSYQIGAVVKGWDSQSFIDALNSVCNMDPRVLRSKLEYASRVLNWESQEEKYVNRIRPLLN